MFIKWFCINLFKYLEVINITKPVHTKFDKTTFCHYIMTKICFIINDNSQEGSTLENSWELEFVVGFYAQKMYHVPDLVVTVKLL